MGSRTLLHHDQDHILRSLRNTNVEQNQQIFTTTANKIANFQFEELADLYGQLSWEASPWKSCTLLHRDTYKQSTAKVYVFSDSVLCLVGKCPQYPAYARVWEQDRISTSVPTAEYRELDSFTGEPFVFEWKIFPGHTAQSKRSKS